MFAIFRGKEYRLAIGKYDELVLCSVDPADLKIGFIKNNEGGYALRVNKEDLDAYYSIDSFAEYKGYRFGISSTEGDKILIFGNVDRKIAESFGMTQVENGVYEKLIEEKDLQRVWEEKSPISL